MDPMPGWNAARVARRSTLACALAAALVACGGGSGGGLLLPPLPGINPDPPPTVVYPPDPAYSGHLADTNAEPAHAAGLTGKGVRIGFLDSGVNRDHPALRDRVVANLTYINPATNNLSVDDVVGHGTAVAQAAAGKPFGAWPGGIAQGAEIVSARIISDTPPDDDGTGAGNEINGPLGLEPIHRDLMNRGVKVMNNSWGGLYWTNLGVTAQIAAEYRPFINSHGGLVVFASGNSGFDDPSDTAALPSKAGSNGSRPAADLERGWLTVSALARDSTTQLADYSNACGVAMHYCLVAPGTVVVTGEDNAPDKPEYYRYSGTSLAAPLVSGTAALVWEAFPYFDNDLVRQTILGTATDIGAPGVDPVFGYGRLDVGKAVLGPAKFDWGDVTANFASGTSVWGNDITGAGGLVKRGGGTLRLDGNAGFDGATRAEGGTLVFASSIPGRATVESGATLELRGARVGGDLLNRGTFSLAGSTLTRTIDGNFQQASGGRFAWQVGSPLQVTGTASLAGELQVAGIASGYTWQARETVLTAAGGRSGTFDSLTQGPGVLLTATLGYDADSAWLDISRLEVTTAVASFAGVTAQSLSSAERVESAFTQIDGQSAVEDGPIADGFIRVAGELQRLPTELQALAALDSLSGALHGAAVNATLDQLDMSRRAVGSRFGDLAALGAGTGAWKQTLGQGGSGGFAGGDFSVDGWSMGRDQLLAGGLVAGVAFGELRGDSQLRGSADRSRDRQAFGQLYAGRMLGNGYLMGQLGSGRFDRSLQRQLFGGAEAQGVATQYSGRYTSAAVEAGYRWRLGNGEIAPYLGADHVRLRSDGFEELGGNGFGLRTAGWDASRTQALAGLRARYDAPWFSLHGYSEWQQTLASNGFDLQASFTGVDAWAPLAGLSPARSGGVAGIGVESWLSRNSRVALGVDQRFGPRGSDRMVSLRFAQGF
ncbi:S8 family serine peptidase [Luteimonas sp. BDR2-5]|uniref:S8 family serine peptidase n=1 Tax=Proluteimonas luteida TaxID=2878685 RepID=UPI001E620B89|nr:autotransporter serine protease [Luteimonas sp. BDR2-5]MCD9027679.1 S8 family serine peptidase [Luteimonas sp. BDR2-5]